MHAVATAALQQGGIGIGQAVAHRPEGTYPVNPLRPLIQSVASMMRLGSARPHRSDHRQIPEWAHRMARKQAAAARR